MMQINQGAANLRDISNSAISYNYAQKGAIIVALLGADAAKPIVEAIEDRHLRNFVAAMQSIELVPHDVLLATIADFVTHMKKQTGGLRGGEKQARELATSLLSSERALRLFGNAADTVNDAPTNISTDVWDRLQTLPIDHLVNYLNPQRTELISIVLSKLGPLKAGEIFAELPDRRAGDVAQHMSSGGEADPDIISAISELIRIELLEKPAENTGEKSANFMTEVMGVLPKKRREALMDIITTENPETANIIRRGLLTFEDLPKRLPKTAIPIVFRDMEAAELLTALKAGVEAAPDTTDFLYANISQRMAEQYKEQVDDLPALSEKDADSAIITLMSFISKKEKSGAIAYIDIAEDV